nr:MAG TPA: ChiA1-BD-binding domain protein [Caudoviricetes sp.]
MKKLKYQLCTEINRGTEDDPQIEQMLSDVTLDWSAANEELAKLEAYNGEYEIIDDGEPEPVTPPSNDELAADIASVQSISIAAFAALCETQVLDGNTAAQHADVFAPWAVGTSYTVGQLRRYNGTLYKCVQAHTSQADWTPDTATSLWTVVDVTHAGTLDDPIPAARGMEYEYGKHYLDTEDSKVYRCARTGEASGGKITLQYLPHELVGQYFRAVSDNAE